MYIAAKGNKRLKIDETMVGKYVAAGFDIQDEKGKVVKKAKDATVSAAQLEKAEGELKKAQAELAKAKEENAALKAELAKAKKEGAS